METKNSLPTSNPWNVRQIHEIVPHLSGLDGISNLDRYKIAVVVSVCQDRELPDLPVSEIKHVRIPVRDNSKEKLKPHFPTISALIHSYRKEGKNVLVHCMVGASRSPTFVMAHLMDAEKMTLSEAHRLVKTKRRVVEPEHGFLLQLLEWEKELYSKSSIDPSLSSQILGSSSNLYTSLMRCSYSSFHVLPC